MLSLDVLKEEISTKAFVEAFVKDLMGITSNGSSSGSFRESSRENFGEVSFH